MAHIALVAWVGDVPKEPGPEAGATRRSWWKMISARAPRTKGLMRHHSSSLRGPRPCPSDTPPPSNQLRHPPPTDLADPLGAHKEERKKSQNQRTREVRSAANTDITTLTLLQSGASTQ